MHLRSLVLLPFLLSLGCAHESQSFAPIEVPASATRSAADLESPVHTIAFGSCNKQDHAQPLWKHIIADRPDIFIWTGDVVYADTEDMGKLSQIYRAQQLQPEYQNFLASGIPVLGVWDDHDYAPGEQGAEYPKKKEAQALFLDFVGEPQASPRRTQDGIYASYNYPDGLRVILLDTRSQRTGEAPTGELLGAAQWSWLEALLQQPAELTVLVSSIQVLGTEQVWDKWSDFPDARARLLKLIDSSKSKNTVIISGDRHFAEFSRLTLPSGQVLNEITASGLTHAFHSPDEARNKNALRVGPLLDRLNYGLLNYDPKGKKLTLEAKDLNRKAIIKETIPLR